MDFKLFFISGATHKKGIWIRIFNSKALVILNSPMIFSERYGVSRYLKLPFGYRVKLVK